MRISDWSSDVLLFRSIVRERIDALPHTGMTIVATGPLTAKSLAESIGAATGKEALAFFDAIAPIVYRDSIDMDICWMASRWDKVEIGRASCRERVWQYV